MLVQGAEICQTVILKLLYMLVNYNCIIEELFPPFVPPHMKGAIAGLHSVRDTRHVYRS